MIHAAQMFNLLACPACRFDPSSETAMAANLAIGVMILVLAGVLGGFLGFIWKMAVSERNLGGGNGAAIRGGVVNHPSPKTSMSSN